MSEDFDVSRAEVAFPDVSELEKIQASSAAVESVLLQDAGTIIATVGNNEAKALTFAAMALRGNGQPISKTNIYKMFIEMQGEEQAWGDIGHGGPPGYARDTFEPIGAVVKSREQAARGVTDHYAVTGYGARVGIAATGMMLDLSLQYPELSLYSIFAKTGTNSEEARRGPGTRLEIFKALSGQGSEYINMNSLAFMLGVEPTAISQSITDLADSGIIEVQRFERGASDKQIFVDDAEHFDDRTLHPGKSDQPTLIREYILAQTNQGAKSVAIEDVIDFATANKFDPGTRGIREYVIDTVRVWERQNLLHTTSEFSNEVRSKIRIKPEYVDLVTEILLHAEGIMQGDQEYLDWGERRAQEILSDVNLVNQLLTKARLSSPYKNQETPEQFLNRITGILAAGKFDADQLAEAVREQGKPVSVASIRRILLQLEEQNQIQHELQSGKKVYSLKYNT